MTNQSERKDPVHPRVCLCDSVARVTSEGDSLYKSTVLMPLSCRSQ